MANTYTQIYIHLVFAVKNRTAMIMPKHQDDIYRYIAGVIKQRDCKCVQIGGLTDHVHILVSLKPNVDISKLVQSIKLASTHYINDNRLAIGKFAWQEGYGAFSISYTHIPAVAKYIENQKDHHNLLNFRNEYRKLLAKNGIAYDDAFIFAEI